MNEKEVYWKVHIPHLFKEIVDNNPEHNSIFRVPLMEVMKILSQIADRTIELNDTKLKLLCCRLTLFEIADPESKEYNRDVFRILENDIRKEEAEQQGNRTIDLNVQAGGGVMSKVKAWNVEFLRSEIILASTREDAEEIAEDFKRKQEMVGKIEEAD